MSAALRVVMIAEYPFSDAEQGRGGVLQSNFHLVEGFELLADPKLDLHVLSQTFGCDRYETRRLGGITLHFVPKQRSEFARFFLNPFHLLRAFLHLRRTVRPDVVHGQGSVNAILLSLWFARRNVQTIHGVYRNEESKTDGMRLSLGRRIRIWMNEAIEIFYLRRIRNLIAITTEIADLVRTATLGRAYIFPNYNAIDPAFFQERLPSAGQHLTILFVAAITPRKGLQFLLDAFAGLAQSHPGITLRIVGIWDWAPDYVANLQQCHAPLIKARKIVFTGGVSREELAAEYSAADMLVLPSLAESAPLVVSQAMCVGLPVIATRVGGLPEMIADGQTGLLVPPGETGPLADAMARLVADAGLRKRLGSAAREVAVSRYHPRSAARATLDIYWAVAAGGGYE
jgi:glycosyltransferase involved in cell wall biosynthesis